LNKHEKIPKMKKEIKNYLHEKVEYRETNNEIQKVLDRKDKLKTRIEQSKIKVESHG